MSGKNGDFGVDDTNEPGSLGQGMCPINAFYNWKPVFGDKLLGASIGRGLGVLKGLIAAM